MVSHFLIFQMQEKMTTNTRRSDNIMDEEIWENPLAIILQDVEKGKKKAGEKRKRNTETAVGKRSKKEKTKEIVVNLIIKNNLEHLLI
jgi:hypothetical protein